MQLHYITTEVDGKPHFAALPRFDMQSLFNLSIKYSPLAVFLVNKGVYINCKHICKSSSHEI